MARLKLAEKLVQISCIWESKRAIFGDELELDMAELPSFHPYGIGEVARPSDAHGCDQPAGVTGV